MLFAPTNIDEFARDLENCGTFESVVERLNEASKSIMPAFAILRPPVPIDDPIKWVIGGNIFFHPSVPPGLIAGWRDQMNQHGGSPIGRRSQRDGTAFLWSELRRQQQFKGQNLWPFDLVLKYRMTDLYTVPVAPWRVIYMTYQKRFVLVSAGRASLGWLANMAILQCKVVAIDKPIPGVLPTSLLSRREQEVLGLLADGKTGRVVAKHLELLPSTVKMHIEHIRQKLNARNTTNAVSIAVRHHLISAGMSCWWWLAVIGGA